MTKYVQQNAEVKKQMWHPYHSYYYYKITQIVTQLAASTRIANANHGRGISIENDPTIILS